MNDSTFRSISTIVCNGLRHHRLLGCCALALALCFTVVIASAQANKNPAPAPVAVGSPIRMEFGDYPASADANLLAAGKNLQAPTWCFVQINGPLTAQLSTALTQAGLADARPVDSATYRAKLTNAQLQSLRAIPGMRWVGVYEPAARVSGVLRAEALRAGDADTAPRRMSVFFFKDTPAGAAEAALVAQGVTVDRVHVIDGQPRIRISAPLQRLDALSKIPEVEFIEPLWTRVLFNDKSAWVLQSNVSNQTTIWAKGIHGEGQHVNVIDTPADLNHCHFIDTANPIGPSHRKCYAYRCDVANSGDHGTHVAGTCVGENVDGSTFKNGMAYKAKMSFGSLDDLNTGSSTFMGYLTGGLGDGATVHTNSWGYPFTQAYVEECHDLDDFMWNNEDSLIVFACGNFDTISAPATAKNCLSVSATRPAPNQNLPVEGCCHATGPTPDGRMNPQITAPGDEISSAQLGTACGFVNNTGTSMATPAISGMALLVRQYFTEGWYPTGLKVPANSLTPSGALLKAMICNAGVDMSGFAGYPNNQEGWGRLLLENSLFFDGEARKTKIVDRRRAQGLGTNEEFLLGTSIAPNNLPFRVTLVWNDFASSIGAQGSLINDLDLIVEGPTGTYYGNDINTTTGDSRTTQVRDSVNNVEQVNILFPTAGIYSIRVRGVSVSAPVSPPKQGFALVLSGPLAPAGALSIVYPGGPPAQVPPLVPVNINVQITPLEENIVAGSTQLFYRLPGQTSFNPVQLLATGGNNMYGAQIPALPCGGSVQFYVSAVGSGGTTVTFPANAPTAFNTANANNITADCNGNGIDDACDISSGASTDCGGNGVPDECELTVIANAGPNRNACVGSAGVQVGANTPAIGGTPPYNYQWSVTSGPAQTGFDNPNAARPFFSPPVAGQYTLTLSVTDASPVTCASTDTMNVTARAISVTASADIEASTNQTVVLATPQVQTSAAGTLSYSWRIAAPPNPPATLAKSASASPEFTATEGGTYTIEVTATDSGGCAATDSMVITVSAGFIGGDFCGAGACGPQGMTLGILTAWLGLWCVSRRRRRRGPVR